ncbi:MAG: alkaline phosphatase family protein [Pseudomonadota bacterium]
MKTKLLLIVIDGVPWRNWRRLFGNLEGWVASGEARVWRMRSALPSTSASCYASIHTGLSPQVHGVLGNNTLHRVARPDIFSAVRAAGGVTGAVAHSFWSTFFRRCPFEPLRDLEFDEADGETINHGRFHTMTGYNKVNQATPADADMFNTLTLLCQRFALDYGLLHTCTLDSLGHRVYHECHEMDHACFMLDEQLAQAVVQWRALGYEVIVTADHGQSDRGHHGGVGEDQQDYALYYFGEAETADDGLLDQLQLAPSVLTAMGVDVPDSMSAAPFLRR